MDSLPALLHFRAVPWWIDGKMTWRQLLLCCIFLVVSANLLLSWLDLAQAAPSISRAAAGDLEIVQTEDFDGETSQIFPRNCDFP